MDIMDVVSSGIQKITGAYGKKVQKKYTAPEIPDAKPVEISGNAFRLGFAREEIMPDLSLGKTYYIAGHGSGHVMDGILTPVYVHAVWIDCGKDEGMIWLSADIVGMTNIEITEIRNRIFASKVIKGCKAVNFSSTHSHSGIDTVGYWGKPFLSIPANGKVPEYMEMLFANALKAAEAAYLAREEGKLYTGRIAIPDGLFTKRKFGDKHEVLTRLRFVPASGKAETWLVNIGGHPNSLGGANRKLSGEYPYFMREHIKDENGANVLFCIGAIGGMDAAMYEETDDPLDRVKYQGRLFATAAENVSNDKELEPKIKFINQQFYLPVSNNVLTVLAMRGTMSFKPFPCKESATGIAMRTELTYLTIGSQKFVLLPGENFVTTVYGGYLDAEHSTTGKGPEINPTPLAEIAGDPEIIAVGVTNDMTGYVVPPNDFVLNPTQPYLNGTKDRFGDNHYHETNSMGPDTQKVIADTFAKVVKNF